jgi:SAM-dependent methyltransferase
MASGRQDRGMDMRENERRWAAGVERYVLGNLPDRPARVLEVGCGGGELAVAMDRAGHQVTAVDPEAPEGPIFRRTTIEELQDAGPFDAVVASLALHHFADPGKVLDKCVRLLTPDGRVIVVEYARERFDDTAARWYVQRRRHDPAEPGWLENRYQAWLQARASGGTASFSRWHQRRSREEGIHEGATVLRELRDRFAERSLAWGPYLYLDLDVPEADEAAAIARGELPAISFRFVGRRRRSALP